MLPNKIFAGLLGVAAMLASCSSAEKATQTVDDVYYSAGRGGNDEVKKEASTADDYSYSRPDDNYLRMKVQNRRQWSDIDDRDYWYSYDYNCRCNNNWSVYNRWGYNSWNSWYSWNQANNYYGYNSGWGYGYGYPIAYVKAPRSNTGAKPYMNGYTNRTYNNSNVNYSNGKTGTSSNGFGSLMKTIFGGTSNSNSTSTQTYSRPVRTFEPSSSSVPTSQPASSSSSSSSSSSNSSSGRSSSSGSSTSTGRSGRGN